MRRVCVTRGWKLRHAYASGRSIVPAAATVTGPLFQGTLYLANLTFTGPGGPWSVALTDLAVVQQYLQRIASPVTAYASQYGPTQLAVGPALPPLGVALSHGQYSDQQLQGWVNALAGANRLGAGAAIIVINPPGIQNLDAKESGGVGVLGYHGSASVPYSFVNALGSGFTSEDHADLFAEAVSHEVAEMTVDPRADDSNPEVCDGCGTNCQGSSAYRAYFDDTGKYLGTETSFPPSYSYAFFLSGIARPASAADCPAPASACAYPPP